MDARSWATDGNDVFVGDDSDEIANGLGGDDILDGGGGNDTVVRIDDTYFITLKNVTGEGDNVITIDDFILS